MYSVIILGLILILRCAPTFMGEYTILDESYNTQDIFDRFAFVLFSLYIFKDVQLKKFYRYPIHVLLLVVSLFFAVNYMSIDAVEEVKTYLEIGDGR